MGAVGMGRVRQILFLAVVFVHVVIGVLWIRGGLLWDRLRGRAMHTGASRRAQVAWCRQNLRLFGVRIEVRGEPLVPAPAMIVSNHISWLDILALATVMPVGFVSKSEIRNWPLVGATATGLGTLYIERGRRGAAEATINLLSNRMAQGRRVLLFVEGTTGDGAQLLRFRPRLMQAAVDSEVPVQPVTLAYRDASGGLSAAAPFIGDDTMLQHVYRLAASGPMTVTIHLGEPIESTGRSRSELALLCREQMTEFLGLAVEDSAEADAGIAQAKQA